MTNVIEVLLRKRCGTTDRSEITSVSASEKRRWTLRCRDLLARESFVITQVDQATGDVLLHVTGSKPVLLPGRDVERLRQHLAEAIDVVTGGVAEGTK